MEKIDLGITNLGHGEIFLGHNWLKKHNPQINWNNSLIEFNRCPPTCHTGTKIRSMEQEDNIDLEDDDQLLIIDLSKKLEICARTNIVTKLVIKEHKKKEEKPWNKHVPEHLHNYEDVFTQEHYNELPPHCPWDHAIKLLPGTKEHLDCKIYPLSLEEQTQLDKSIEEHLRTGHIRPSKSPMASSLFFVKKKDGQLLMVQDYQKLNDMTIKNKYPLPLISELIDTLQNTKYFTKLDVCWGYNNVRIKEGDEFKTAFRTN
jgi:hypothetical protein